MQLDIHIAECVLMNIDLITSDFSYLHVDYCAIDALFITLSSSLPEFALMGIDAKNSDLADLQVNFCAPTYPLELSLPSNTYFYIQFGMLKPRISFIFRISVIFSTF